mmetsp:Transcript_11715/g.17183  ORF Transcript_11715/g.17183 Transcript_11715/m.17183 type:complete len:188 (+) Transcript_11715:107-670(+)|eukprot:CAMPEP_0194212104 /NCGR_PEP_ID=MMETSP0156-20130528/11756_1 /TAXON_ID=33649 /ORGANISM="Thalassionema nitzschioides, Strain L26-B" /LENGTH=187 /DNA_ID=CAMNT_0038939843 /DNA_START=77 /DNA_END=640 /DNA_ORIENTATION=+
MPVNPQYSSPFIPHAINATKEKGLDTVMRKVDERSGDMMLFDVSQSSLELIDNADDIESLMSEESQSSTQSDETVRRVRFAERLVIFQRPPTAPEDKTKLHYTNEELFTFRMEYRSYMRSKLAAKRAKAMKMNLLETSYSLYNGFHGMLSSVAEAASSLVQSEIDDSPQEQETRLESNTVIDTLYLF